MHHDAPPCQGQVNPVPAVTTAPEGHEIRWPAGPPAPRTFEEAVDAILAEMRAVMISRQRKYGPGNVLRLGIRGVLDRAMHDKMERLRRYYDREDLRARCREAGMPKEVIDRYLPSMAADYGDEALEDAHIDAANYVGVIALMLRRGWWGLPMEDEVKRVT